MKDFLLLAVTISVMAFVTSLPPVDSNSYRVLIEDLRVELRLGIKPQEVLRTQSAIVNIAMDMRRQWQNAPESIREVICYETVAGRIRDMFQGKQVYLVESMAEQVARSCLQWDDRVLKVLVRVEKLGVVESTRAVGVEVLRRRACFSNKNSPVSV